MELPPDGAFADEEDERQGATLLSGAQKDPQRTAQARQYGQRFNLPPDTADWSMEQLKALAKVEEMRAETVDTPSLGAWLAAHPDHAAMAQNETRQLAGIERAQRELTQWNPSAGERVTSWIRDLFGMPARDRARAANEFAARGEGMTTAQAREALGGISEIPEQAASKALNAASFGLVPDVAGEAQTGAGGVAGGAGYFAGFIAGPYALAARGLERLGVKSAMAPAATDSFVKGLAKRVAQESLTLGAASGLAGAGDLINSPTLGAAAIKAFEQTSTGAALGAVGGAAAKFLPDNTLTQLAGRFTANTAGNDLVAGKTPFSDVTNWDALTPAQKGDVAFNYLLNAFVSMHGAGRTEGGWFRDAAKADIATADAAATARMVEASITSQLREMAPDKFKESVRLMSDEGIKEFYVAPEKIVEAYAQAGVSLEELQRNLPGVHAQLAEALPTGRDVVIPLEDYLTHIAPFGLDANLRGELKTNPDGMTFNEGQAFHQEAVQRMQAEADQILEKSVKTQADRDQFEQVKQIIQPQLEGAGRTKDVANVEATIHAVAMRNFAQRMGVDPVAFAKEHSPSVVGAATDAALASYKQRSYEGAPDGLMGYKTQGPQTPFGENRYKHAAYVRVKWSDGSSILDAIEGLNGPHALERAHRNWKDAQSIEVVDRELVMKEDPELVRGVERMMRDKAQEYKQDGSIKTNTEAFRNWFGKSKVVDGEGKPLVVYHGTSKDKDFAKFNVGARGAWFTSDSADASMYAKDNDSQKLEYNPETRSFDSVNTASRVMPTYLRIENPYRITEADMQRLNAENYAKAQRELFAQIKAAGHDGIDFGGGTWVALDAPTQIKSVFNDGSFDPNNPNILKQAHSTRVPTAKKDVEDHLAEVPLKSEFSALKREPEKLEQNMNLIRQYPNFKSKARSPEKQAEDFIGHVKDNLLWLHDQIPEDIRQRSKLWYDGARAIAERFSSKYGVTDTQAAGVLAVLSPQKDWFQNVSLAERVMDIYLGKKDHAWDDAMSTTADRIFGKPQYAQDLAEIRGKTLGEMTSLAQKAMWVRTYDEAHNARSHRIVTPEGDFGAMRKTKAGVDQKVAWGSLNEIGKGISILEDGTARNISDRLGTQHKVRNFYNNIYAPGSEHGFVTIDTHAVAAGLLRPLSGGSAEVLHNFGSGVVGQGGPAQSAKTGLSGTYAIYQEAYQRAAKERGILPREMQSITWEAVRGLFQDTFKSQERNVNDVDEIWRGFRSGKLDLEAARQQALQRAGGIEHPEWHGSGAGRDAPAWDSTYKDELRRDELPDGGAESAAAGIRRVDAGGIDGLLSQEDRGGYDPLAKRIALLQNADLSTFIHELGHHYLELFADLAAREGAPDAIRKDLDTIFKYVGVESLDQWRSLSIDEKRPAHEKFAQSMEQYFLEGKPPSLELAGPMARVKAWMQQVYQGIKNLVTLTPEVREVFDRMFASEEEIKRAEAARSYLPILSEKDAAKYGVTPEAYQAYIAQGQEATDSAISVLQARSLKDMKWATNARSKAIKAMQREASALREKIQAEVTQQVIDEPVELARDFLKTNPEMGVDWAADMAGFKSGDELRKALESEPSAEDKITARTSWRMLQEHGDLVNPEALERAANEAIHNEARARFMATGLKMLTAGKMTSGDILRAAKEAAQAAIAGKRIKDLSPRAYEIAEAKATRKVLELAPKDPAAAAEAQRAALLNNLLAKYSREAGDEVNKTVAYLKRLHKGAAQDAMRGEYLDQLNALLGRFDIRVSASQAKDRVPLAEWVASETERLSAVVPELPDWVLNEGFRTHYTEMSVEQLRGLRDAVRQLEQLARREQKQYMAIRAMEFAQERDGVLDEIRSVWAEAFDSDGKPKGLEPDFVPSVRRAVGRLGSKFAGEFLNTETLLSILSGDKFGVAQESLFGRLSSRSDWKAERLSGIYKTLKPLFKAYSLKERHDFSRKDISTVAGIDTPLTRENALVVALLYGNAEGRERLENYGWSAQKQQSIVDLLDKRDIDLANAIWKLFDTDLWPELEALNNRTRGKAPPKVEAVPFKAKGGRASGGYFRLKYDTALDERVQRLDEAQAVKDLLGGSMGMSAKTQQGSSIERKQGVALRPRLDLGVFAEAVNETVHDLAYREAVADTMRMLNDGGIQNAVKQVVGVEGYRALVTRVREVAAPPRNPSGFIETTISVARRNTVINLMSGVKTALQNITGLFPAMAEVNSGSLLLEVGKFYSPKMMERYDFAMKHSAFMRNRFTHYDRDLQNSVQQLTVNGSLRPSDATFLGLMGFVDRGVSVPLWNAGFREGMKTFRNDVPRAIAYADSIVRKTQGSGRDVDLAKIMSGHGGWGQLKKAFTMFYSYFNAQLNLLVRQGVIARLEAQQNPSLAAAKLAAKMVAIVVVPTILTEWLMRGTQDESEADEDYATRMSGAFVRYGAGLFPFVRDIVPGIWSTFTGDRYFGTKITPLDSAAQGVVAATKSAADVLAGEGNDTDTKNLILGVGYLTGTPGKLVSDTYAGWNAWMDGEAGPQAIILGPPPR